MEKEMATYSIILAWRILWTEEPGGATVHTVAQSQTRLRRLSMHTCIGEGNGNPLQCSAWRIPGTGEPVTPGHD